MKLDVLAFAAHPDDIELNCGGTVAALVNQGKAVGIVDLTQGEMGTRGTVETRKAEATDAADILGVQFRTNLGIPDSQITNTRVHQLKIIEVVRQTQPSICLIGAPWDRHPDHGKATTLMADALFYSGLRKIETSDHEGAPQAVWRPAHILHYMQDRPFEPDFVFDISDTFETKQKSLLAYATQFKSDGSSGEPETYISSQRYFDAIKGRAAFYGHLGGFTYGEPFKYYNGPVPLNSLDFLFDLKTGR